MRAFDPTTSFGHDESMRYDTVDRTYGLVYLVYNTIGNLLTQDDQVRCFENAAPHLTDGGVFVLECRVPTAPSRPGHQFVDAEVVGVDHVVLDVCRYDPVSQVFDCGTGGEGGTESPSPPPAGATSASTSERWHDPACRTSHPEPRRSELPSSPLTGPVQGLLRNASEPDQRPLRVPEVRNDKAARRPRRAHDSGSAELLGTLEGGLDLGDAHIEHRVTCIANATADATANPGPVLCRDQIQEAVVVLTRDLRCDRRGRVERPAEQACVVLP